MNKRLLNIKALVSAGTSTFLAAVTFFALISSALICVSAQQKGKSAQTKQQTVQRGAADQQRRQRADALLAQMTLDEKIGQLNQLFFFSSFQKEEWMNDGIRKGEISSLLFVTDPAMINRFQKIAVTESRLKIPLIFGFDVIHGFHTIFPVPIAMAASWDPKMVEATQTVAAREARAVGINWTFAPMVDIARDPRWGRIVEGGHQQAGSASRPIRELKGFERVALTAGETKNVRFKLGPEELRYWSAAARDWVQEAENFDVWVGNDSSASLHSTFRVTQ
jgi:beta-glucosidase